MNKTDYKKLNDLDKKHLMDIPFYIVVMISGADKNIEETEIEWADKIIKSRARNSKNNFIRHYYEEVADNFSDKIFNILSHIPSDTEERNEYLDQKMIKNIKVLKKIDNVTRENLISGYKSLAKTVAKRSGGMLWNFLVFGSIDNEERKWMDRIFRHLKLS